MINLQKKSSIENLRKKELRLTAIYHVTKRIEDMDNLIKCKMDISSYYADSIAKHEEVIQSLIS